MEALCSLATSTTFQSTWCLKSLDICFDVSVNHSWQLTNLTSQHPNVKAIFCPTELALIAQAWLFIVVMVRWWWIWSIGGMIMTEENWSIQRKTCPSATLSTTNLTRTDLGSKLVLCSEKLADNHLSHSKAISKPETHTDITQKFSSDPKQNTACFY
jgi:hypothetical protein